MSGADQGAGAFAAAAAGLRAAGPWDRPVALACSGGADSTFLALAWQRFQEEGAPPAAVFVVDHNHAPHSAPAAAAAVALYHELGFVPRLLTLAPGLRGESALRAARYAALAEAAGASGAAVLLTAHHADDQAETLLLRIARGTGLRGLSGIPPRRLLAAGLELRRPLLGLRRGEIRAALRAGGQSWIEDPTNQELGAAARNRVRAELLPALAAVATGDPVLALLRLAAEARDLDQGVGELLAGAAEWRALPSYFRRQAVAAQLRACGETVSPARLLDLEGALLRNGSAAIHAQARLSLRDGRLRLLTVSPAD